MYDVDKQTKTAGIYVMHKGLFVFAFGFSKKLGNSTLGIIRLGGHRELGESAEECAIREAKEEASINCELIPANETFHFNPQTNNCEKTDCIYNNAIKPIFIHRKERDKISSMYLAHSNK